MANLVRFKQQLKESIHKSFVDIFNYSLEDDSLYLKPEYGLIESLMSETAGFSVESLCESYVRGYISEQECLSRIESINV